MDKTAEIVVTGGPCGGKTTGLSFVQQKLMDRGWRPFIVPEVATILITGGLHDLGRIAAENPEAFLSIQKQFMRTQMALIKQFRDLAALFRDERCVLIYDRGPMDIAAYLPAEQFKAILEEERLSISDARDDFDAVIHLLTAADGAEEFYTLQNNKARRETAEEARALDKRTQAAWHGHPHLRIIDNSSDFRNKMNRFFQTISRVLGIPVPLEIERKFLLKTFPDVKELGDVQRVFIEQTYLEAAPGRETRIRKRCQDNCCVYYKTQKIRHSSLVREETEKRISEAEYLELERRREPSTGVIRKWRHCFVYKNQYFELDQFVTPPELALLEIELTEENDRVELPPFLAVDREVTDDSAYTNVALAARVR